MGGKPATAVREIERPTGPVAQGQDRAAGAAGEQLGRCVTG